MRRFATMLSASWADGESRDTSKYAATSWHARPGSRKRGRMAVNVSSARGNALSGGFWLQGRPRTHASVAVYERDALGIVAQPLVERLGSRDERVQRGRVAVGHREAHDAAVERGRRVGRGGRDIEDPVRSNKGDWGQTAVRGRAGPTHARTGSRPGRCGPGTQPPSSYNDGPGTVSAVC